MPTTMIDLTSSVYQNYYKVAFLRMGNTAVFPEDSIYKRKWHLYPDDCMVGSRY